MAGGGLGGGAVDYSLDVGGGAWAGAGYVALFRQRWRVGLLEGRLC